MLLASGRDLNVRRLAARKDGPHELLDTVSPSECCKGTLTTDTTTDRDTNKIRFDFTRGAFKVLYFEGGSLKSVSKGFEVPRTDAMGLVLCRHEYARVKAGVLHKARMAWNRLDQSDAPRFQEQTSGDVAVVPSNRDGGLQPANNEGA